MPSYNITINYQTADLPEILAGIRGNYGLPPETPTNDILAKLKEGVALNIADMTQRERIRIAQEAAMAAVPPPVIIT